jgi:hypothetical protein
MVGKRVQFDEEAREALRKEIAVAEGNIAVGKALIARQRQIISNLVLMAVTFPGQWQRRVTF